MCTLPDITSHSDMPDSECTVQAHSSSIEAAGYTSIEKLCVDVDLLVVISKNCEVDLCSVNECSG